MNKLEDLRIAERLAYTRFENTYIQFRYDNINPELLKQRKEEWIDARVKFAGLQLAIKMDKDIMNRIVKGDKDE